MGLLQLIRLLARGLVDGLRRNKLPACLSFVALILTTVLAYTSDFDERPRYRRVILPQIENAETKFFDVMRDAEREPTEPWRMLTFIDGHRRAKQALQVIQGEHPLTDNGRKAQRNLVRYYELVDEELAIIRTEMSNNESYDYIAEWKRDNARLLPIRDRWWQWVNPPGSPGKPAESDPANTSRPD
jgi:hypothetical protein